MSGWFSAYAGGQGSAGTPPGGNADQVGGSAASLAGLHALTSYLLGGTQSSSQQVLTSWSSDGSTSFAQASSVLAGHINTTSQAIELSAQMMRDYHVTLQQAQAKWKSEWDQQQHLIHQKQDVQKQDQKVSEDLFKATTALTLAEDVNKQNAAAKPPLPPLPTAGLQAEVTRLTQEKSKLDHQLVELDMAITKLETAMTQIADDIAIAGSQLGMHLDQATSLLPVLFAPSQATEAIGFQQQLQDSVPQLLNPYMRSYLSDSGGLSLFDQVLMVGATSLLTLPLDAFGAGEGIDATVIGDVAATDGAATDTAASAAGTSTTGEASDPFALRRTHGLSGSASSKTVKTITQSMSTNGWVGDPVEVIEQDGNLYIINGHHRVIAALRAGISVPWRTLTPEELLQYGYSHPSEVVDAWSRAPGVRLR